ncbi:MAG: biotin/lipoyl-binding protein [Ignavibacteriaceae bacterium]|nr:biotin/lipoyl-binding protein [Ignavibacteriaceae bacterium]
MAIEFRLPELGENIESADVVTVLVKAGDIIEMDRSVIEIETDKATVEVPSNVTGKITEVLVKEGDSVKVNQVILKIDESKKQKTEVEVVVKETKIEEPKETVADEKVKMEKGKSEIAEIKLPELGENIESADVIAVLIKAGDFIQIDQGIIEIETDKATVEVPSSVEGEVIEVLAKVNETSNVGDVLIKVKTTISPVPKIKDAIPETDTEDFEKLEKNTATPKGEVDKLKPGEADSQPEVVKGAAPAAPSVRRIAREIGVDINEVKGTGPGGRISMDDVKAYSKKLHQERKDTTGFGIKQEALPDFRKFGAIEKAEMTKIRKVTAEHLSYAWATIPHVTQHDKADITQLEKSRKQYNPEVEKAGGKLTITSILLKIIIAALNEFPQFNSSIDMDSKEIIYKKYFNIGVAVDTEHGLMVPVIKNVDEKNLIELSVEMGELAKKAREKKVSLEDLQGGCFTITNLGGIGGTLFTPVVNSPEVAILGVSRGSYKPIYNEKNEFKSRLMLPLSLSYDHRIIDGADAARFLRFIVEALEQPLKIL